MTNDVVASAAETSAANGHGDTHSTAGFGALLIGSIGVVYGDIGTSPLYALREAVTAASSGDPARVTSIAVFGVVSLILWALIVVVTLKYVVILLRADNNGEGGTLALMALAQRAVANAAPTIVLLGIISGALFYGDAVITPALSVLSAIEGIKLVTATFDPYVVPLTVVILLALFAVQSRGTARVAIVGTFDVENYGDLLFPLLAEDALQRRLGEVELVPVSYHRRSPPDWPYAVTPVADLPALAPALDALLVGGDGSVLVELMNTTGDGDVTGHPELALAAWASLHLSAGERAAATLYTSCESCAMCAGGQYWSGIGRLVFPAAVG